MGNKLSYPEVDLSGKVAIVTGGNTGIGYETAKGLARLGAHTFIACRSKERAEGAIERLKAELAPEASKKEEEKTEGKEGKAEEGASEAAQETAGEDAAGEGATPAEQGKEGEEGNREGEKAEQKVIKVEYIPLDLSSFQSTLECVRAFKERNLPLHILVDNAAVWGVPYGKTDAGFETHFHVNHLGHMLLTMELLPIIVDTAATSGDCRIVIVSSYGHYMAQPFDVNKLNREESDYTRQAGYGNTKLYNVMMGFALQRRLQNKNITVSSLHPGYVQTELGQKGFQDRKFLYGIHQFGVKAFGRNSEKGAATSLNCAVNPALNSRQHIFYENCRPKQPSTDSRNEEFQEQLWKKSFEYLKDYLSPETVENYGPKVDTEVATGNQEGTAETAGNAESQATTDNQDETAVESDATRGADESATSNQKDTAGGEGQATSEAADGENEGN